jgi:glycine cleavage system aminomethyltransferase T
MSSVTTPRLGLSHAGYHALNSLRIENAYRFRGHHITDEDTPPFEPTRG